MYVPKAIIHIHIQRTKCLSFQQNIYLYLVVKWFAYSKQFYLELIRQQTITWMTNNMILYGITMSHDQLIFFHIPIIGIYYESVEFIYTTTT